MAAVSICIPKKEKHAGVVTEYQLPLSAPGFAGGIPIDYKPSFVSKFQNLNEEDKKRVKRALNEISNRPGYRKNRTKARRKANGERVNRAGRRIRVFWSFERDPERVVICDILPRKEA